MCARVQLSMRQLEHTYAKLGVHFDHIHRESDYAQNAKTMLDQWAAQG
jgi:arginyl-tRNA synthetase